MAILENGAFARDNLNSWARAEITFLCLPLLKEYFSFSQSTEQHENLDLGFSHGPELEGI
jgi:hypothetical protein